MKKFFVLLMLFLLGCMSAIGELTIITGPVSNITRTTAISYASLSDTNGTTNAVDVILYYGQANGYTNTSDWTYSLTNTFLTPAIPLTISNSLSSLAAGRYYFCRYFAAQDSNIAWSTLSTNFITIAGTPTNPSPAVTHYPVMVDTNGNIVSPTNNPIFTQSSAGTNAQARVAILETNTATIAQGIAATNAQARVAVLETNTATLAQGIAATNAQARAAILETNTASLAQGVAATNAQFRVAILETNTAAETSADFISWTNGTSVASGASSDATDGGAVIGYNSTATNNGVAVGKTSHGDVSGVALGYSATATNYGTAIGRSASGKGMGNVAIGYNANAGGASGNYYTAEIGSGTATNLGWLHYRGKAIVDDVGQIPGSIVTGIVNNANQAIVATWSANATNADNLVAWPVDNLTVQFTNSTLKVNDRIENNFMLLQFDYITRMGLTEFGMADGRVDTFRNEACINTNAGKSTNQTYYSTPNFYYSNLKGSLGVSGGSQATYTASSTNWVGVTFRTSGVFTVLSAITNVDIVVVAGGGGGGPNVGGGGGAGGYRTIIKTNLTVGTYNVVVGAGGVAGQPTIGWIGGVGGDSSFGTFTANGGGGGAMNWNYDLSWTNAIPGNGGSGGGAGALVDVTSNYYPCGTGNIAVCSPAQGNNGGYVTNSADTGAGGGGAGAVGDSVSTNNKHAASGGIGISNNFANGTYTWYAGGGGGGVYTTDGIVGQGGLGGGGMGGVGVNYAGTNGTANTGGGGGGGAGGGAPGANGGSGGSGIVIIRYDVTSSSYATNMILITTNYPMSFVPLSARGTIWQQPETGTVTSVNTDFNLAVSRNNGTNYTTQTLVQADNYYVSVSSQHMFASTCSLTNQPVGSNIVIKVETLNTKPQRIYGLGFTVGN